MSINFSKFELCLRVTQAFWNCFSPIIRVLSTISFPGPNAMHFCVLPLHVELTKSHGSPVSMHFAPIVFGETSPRFELAKAATNGPCYVVNKQQYLNLLSIKETSEQWQTFPGMISAPLTKPSNNNPAYPLLSDEMKGLVLFMLVQWTAYQFIMPIGWPVVETNFSWTISLSVL